MSPGNSYFKKEIISNILKKALLENERIGIFIPDIPAIATYIALGYPENIARREKAIPQGNAFRNRIQGAILEQGIDPSRVIIFDWRNENIETRPEYQESYSYVKNLYLNNEDFRVDIQEATKQVLVENPFRKNDLTSANIEIGTHYIISEFAFMLFLPTYLTDYTDFTYAYHKPWPVWEKFIEGFYDNTPKLNLRFLKLPDFSVN